MNKDELTNRAMLAFKCKTLKELADLFNISPQDLSNRKSKGTLYRLIETEAYKRSVNIYWIKTGQGEMTIPATVVNETSAHYGINEEMPLIGKADLVLNSNTIYGAALKQNIEAFYQAYLKERSPKKNNPEIPSGAPKDAAGDAG